MATENNPIVEKSFQFALEITIFCEELDKIKKFRLSNQLFGSGTSVGAQVYEAQNAESRKDFIHKIKLALKESEETKFWLRLCESSPVLPSNPNLIPLNDELLRILGKILSSTNNNSK